MFCSSASSALAAFSSCCFSSALSSSSCTNPVELGHEAKVWTPKNLKRIEKLPQHFPVPSPGKAALPPLHPQIHTLLATNLPRLITIQTTLLSQPLLFQWYYLLKIVCRQAPILSLRGCVVNSTWEYLRSFRQRTRVNDFIPLHRSHICQHSRIRKLGSATETL